MTATTTETLTVNGVVLNNYAYNISSLAGRLRAPALRTDNVTVPGRHGTIRVPNKRYEEGQIILPMWVKACNANGDTTFPREYFYQNLDTLTELFRPGAGLLEVIHTLPDGSQRRAWAECTDAIDVQPVAGGNQAYGTFSVALRVPGVFWEDVNSYAGGLGLSYNGPVTGLLGTTAPIEDATFILTGPLTSVTIEARYNGQALDDPMYFTYSGVIGTGQTLDVNCSNWTLVPASGGLVVDYTKMFHTGGSRWLTMVPGPNGGAPELKVTTTGGVNGTSNVGFVARRKFLVG